MWASHWNHIYINSAYLPPSNFQSAQRTRERWVSPSHTPVPMPSCTPGNDAVHPNTSHRLQGPLACRLLQGLRSPLAHKPNQHRLNRFKTPSSGSRLRRRWDVWVPSPSSPSPSVHGRPGDPVSSSHPTLALRRCCWSPCISSHAAARSPSGGWAFAAPRFWQRVCELTDDVAATVSAPSKASEWLQGVVTIPKGFGLNLSLFPENLRTKPIS